LPERTATQALALSEANAVDLTEPPADAWTEERVAALVAQMRVNEAETHPSFFTEQCERAAVAARLLSIAARSSVSIR